MKASIRSLFFVFSFILLSIPLSQAGLKWPVFHASAAVVGAPVLSNNFVYVLAADGSIDALDFASGGQTIPSSLGGPASIPPVKGQQAAVFAADSGQMDAIELSSSKRLWHFPPLKSSGSVSSSTGASSASSPASSSANLLPANATLRGLAAGGRLIYAVFSNQTIALNETTGAVRWIRPLTGGGGPAGADDDYVYISDGQNLEAWSSDGQLKWQAPIGPLFKTVPTPDAAAGRVYVSTTKGYVLALNRDTGDTLWAYPLNGWGMSTPTVSGDLVIFGTNEGDVRALEAATGLQRWSTHVGGALWSQPAILQNGNARIALMGSNNNSIFALNTTDGTLLWRYITTDWTNSPSIGWDGRTIVAGSHDGSIWALLASPMCTIDYPIDADLVGPHLELRGRAWAWNGVGRARLFVNGQPMPDLLLNGSGPFNVSLDLTAISDGPLPIQCLAEDSSGLAETDAGRPKVSPTKSADAPLSIMSLTAPTQAEPGQKITIYARNPDGYDLSGLSISFGGATQSASSPADLSAPPQDGQYVLTVHRAGFQDASSTVSVRTNWGPLLFGLLVVVLILGALAYFVLRKKPVKNPTDYSKL